MSELLARLGAPSEMVEQPAVVTEAAPSTPVLITEQQVLFATAAAVPFPPAKIGRRWIDAVRSIGAGLRAAAVISGNEARPKRRHYPAPNDYFEDSRMAREMFRL